MRIFIVKETGVTSTTLSDYTKSYTPVPVTTIADSYTVPDTTQRVLIALHGTITPAKFYVIDTVNVIQLELRAYIQNGGYLLEETKRTATVTATQTSKLPFILAGSFVLGFLLTRQGD